MGWCPWVQRLALPHLHPCPGKLASDALGGALPGSGSKGAARPAWRGSHPHIAGVRTIIPRSSVLLIPRQPSLLYVGDPDLSQVINRQKADNGAGRGESATPTLVRQA